jgi:hypothetical protein
LFMSIGVLVLTLSVGMIVLMGIFTAYLLSDGHVVAADIPINFDVAEGVIAGWEGVRADATAMSTISAVVENPPGDIRRLFVESGLVGAGTYSVMAVLAGGTAVLLLCGRLRWQWLPVMCLLGGAVMVAGEVASQMIKKDAVEQLSMFVQAGEPHWDMPGFGFGMDMAPVLTGLVVGSASILFMVTGRLARVADGVV